MSDQRWTALVRNRRGPSHRTTLRGVPCRFVPGRRSRGRRSFTVARGAAPKSAAALRVASVAPSVRNTSKVKSTRSDPSHRSWARPRLLVDIRPLTVEPTPARRASEGIVRHPSPATARAPRSRVGWVWQELAPVRISMRQSTRSRRHDPAGGPQPPGGRNLPQSEGRGPGATPT
jgi:hypothetical protein